MSKQRQRYETKGFPTARRHEQLICPQSGDIPLSTDPPPHPIHA